MSDTTVSVSIKHVPSTRTATISAGGHSMRVENVSEIQANRLAERFNTELQRRVLETGDSKRALASLFTMRCERFPFANYVQTLGAT
jgi:hypothetical protein